MIFDVFRFNSELKRIADSHLPKNMAAPLDIVKHMRQVSVVRQCTQQPLGADVKAKAYQTGKKVNKKVVSLPNIYGKALT